MPGLPPGPETGPLAQTVAFHRDPLGVLRGARDRYGDVFTMRLATARPVVVVAAPGDVGSLLHADPGGARAGGARRTILPLASPRSVFGGDDAAHAAAAGRGGGGGGGPRAPPPPPAPPRGGCGGAEAAPPAAPPRTAGASAPAAAPRHKDAMAAIAERHALAWPRGRPFRLLERMR